MHEMSAASINTLYFNARVELFANRPPQSGNLLQKIASGLPTANWQFAFRLLPVNP